MNKKILQNFAPKTSKFTDKPGLIKHALWEPKIPIYYFIFISTKAGLLNVFSIKLKILGKHFT